MRASSTTAATLVALVGALLVGPAARAYEVKWESKMEAREDLLGRFAELAKTEGHRYKVYVGRLTARAAAESEPAATKLLLAAHLFASMRLARARVFARFLDEFRLKAEPLSADDMHAAYEEAFLATDQQLTSLVRLGGETKGLLADDGLILACVRNELRALRKIGLHED